MRIGINAKSNFLIFLLVIFLYTYYVGAMTSMLMLYMLILSVPVSFLLTMPLKKCFKISVEIASWEVERGGVAKVDIIIRNKSFMPIPFVYICFMEAGNLRLHDNPNKHLSFSPYETKVINVKYSTDYRGVARIGIKSLVLMDYLGFFSFSLLKEQKEYQYTGKITVLPRISSMRLSSRIMQDRGSTNYTNEIADVLDTIQVFSGEPGYEYRDYQPGDPLHRIHWKLSAKTRQLKVRKNEGGGVSKKRLILDPVAINENGKATAIKKKNRLISLLTKPHNEFLSRKRKKDMDEQEQKAHRQEIEEKTLEAFLSVAGMVVGGGRLAEIWVYSDGRWQKRDISHKTELASLQRYLAGYKFLDCSGNGLTERLPTKTMILNERMNRSFRGGEALVFTASPDSRFEMSMKSLYDYGITTDMVLIAGHCYDAADFTAIDKNILVVIKTDDVLSQISI